jgi:copper chaperone CopZ
MSQTSFLKLTVPTMSCGGCSSKVTEQLQGLTGVQSVAVDLETKQVSVQGDDLDERLIRATLKDSGYEAHA